MQRNQIYEYNKTTVALSSAHCATVLHVLLGRIRRLPRSTTQRHTPLFCHPVCWGRTSSASTDLRSGTLFISPSLSLSLSLKGCAVTSKIRRYWSRVKLGHGIFNKVKRSSMTLTWLFKWTNLRHQIKKNQQLLFGVNINFDTSCQWIPTLNSH